ncbi:MAG: DMT family transporter [Pseudomonadota bacterium]
MTSDDSSAYKKDYGSAAVLVLASVFFFTFTTFIAKSLGRADLNPLHPILIACFRFIFGFLTILPIWLLRKPHASRRNLSLHAGRATFGWLGLACLFYAAVKIPLADANAISFLSVVVALFLSAWLLGESVNRTRWLSAVVSLIGAVLIIKPGSSLFDPYALFGLMAALFIGIEIIFIKRLSDQDDPIRILFLNNLVGATISVVVAVSVWTSPTAAQWFGLAAIGCIMIVAQFLNVQSLRRADASFVAPFWLTVPVFALVLDIWLNGQSIDPLSLSGIAMVASGGALIYRTRN